MHLNAGEFITTISQKSSCLTQQDEKVLNKSISAREQLSQNRQKPKVPTLKTPFCGLRLRVSQKIPILIKTAIDDTSDKSHQRQELLPQNLEFPLFRHHIERVPLQLN